MFVFNCGAFQPAGLNICPVSISTIHDIEMITAGLGWGRHTVALLHDGTVWAWGDNERGQLGVDTALTQTFEPIEVTSINNVIDILEHYVAEYAGENE